MVKRENIVNVQVKVDRDKHRMAKSKLAMLGKSFQDFVNECIDVLLGSPSSGDYEAIIHVIPSSEITLHERSVDCKCEPSNELQSGIETNFYRHNALTNKGGSVVYFPERRKGDE